MINLEFCKMEGAGNDFIVFDNRTHKLTIEKIISLAPILCNRRFGIGADGVLVLQHPTMPKVDYTMLYRNADGSDAGMCGNGSRCLALFAKLNGFSNHQVFNVHNAIYEANVSSDNESVSISFPDVNSPSSLQIDDLNFVKVYSGTEHVVTFVDEEELANEDKLVDIGRTIRHHDRLNPPGTNVNFVASTNESVLDLQTYERGVEDLTLACGTGAIGSAIAHHHKTTPTLTGQNRYKVHVKGGLLEVYFSFDAELNTYTNIELKGPAVLVFKGSINV